VAKIIPSREVKPASVPDAEAQQLAGGQMQFAFTTMQFTGFGNPNGFQRTVQSHPKLPAAQQKAMRELRADLLSRLKQRAVYPR
jgi:hypothetical protein